MPPRTKMARTSLSYTNRKRLSTLTPSPGYAASNQTQPCSLMLSDIFIDAIERMVNLEREMQTLRDAMARYDPVVNDLNALRYLINPPSQPDLKLATAAGNVINNVASEISRRLRSAKNAVVFNVPDDIKLNVVQAKLLNICNLNLDDCECIRLRKKHQKYTCPLLLKFKCETQAELFIKSQNYLQQFTQFKNIRIIKDRTPLERALYIKPTAPTSCKVVNDGQKTVGCDAPQVVIGKNTKLSPTKPPARTSFASSPRADRSTSRSAQRPRSINQITPIDLDLTLADPSHCDISTHKAKPASPLKTPYLCVDTTKAVNSCSPRNIKTSSNNSSRTNKISEQRRHVINQRTTSWTLSRQRSAPVLYSQTPSPHPLLRATLFDRNPQPAVQSIRPSKELAASHNSFRGTFQNVAPAMLEGPTFSASQTHLVNHTIPRYLPPIAQIPPPPNTQMGFMPPRLPNLMDFHPLYPPHYYPAFTMTQPPPSIT